MPRQPRKYQVRKSLVFHIINRGVLKQTIFHDEKDFQQFIDLVSRYARKEDARIYHWCLMHNHYHVLLEIPDPLYLSKIVGGWQQVYAVKYHNRHRTAGRLFQSRFKCQAVDKELYLMACGRYIEQNPIRADLCEHAWEWSWSSAGFYVEGTSDPLTSRNPQWENRTIEEYRLWIEERSSDDEKLFRSARDVIGGEELQKGLLREAGRFVRKRKGRRCKRKNNS